MTQPPSLIIDGHNLIGRMHGLSLRELDDEERLLNSLQVYARLRRKRIEVYFDGAAPGQNGPRPSGTILAIFVPKGNTADAAIRARLVGLGKAARNLTVVSSDRMVQREARSRGASIISSDDFARELLAASDEDSAKHPAAKKRAASTPTPPPPDPGPVVSPGEVEEWMKIFQQPKPTKK